MPSLTKIYNWISQDKDFANKIVDARRIGAQSYIEEAMDQLDHADNRNIMIIREKVQLAKWLCTKLIPLYGDKQEIKQDTTIEIKWQQPAAEKIIDVDAVEVGSSNASGSKVSHHEV
tara:strand:+ start:1025 stop:1375 length:351 start_codon:yes stop_codon:yes gene_type:complete